MRQTYYTASILSTIGVGILPTAGDATVYGSEARSFPKAVPERVYEVGGVGISLAQILVLSIAVAVMIALHLIVNRARLGLALRAVSERPSSASLLGVPVRRVVIITFLISGLIVRAAGVLTGLTYGTISPYIGLDATLKGLAIMVLGGLGNVAGAMTAGFLIGVIEVLSVAYVSASFRNALAFLTLIIVLTVRPQGLFGTRTREARV